MAKIKKYRRKSRIYTKFGVATEQVRVISKKDREREKEARHAGHPDLNVEMPPDTKAGYFDGFGISFSESEFVLDFMKNRGAPGTVMSFKVHTRVITSPVTAKKFRAALEENIRNHEKREKR
jgi:hypothetical protein